MVKMPVPLPVAYSRQPKLRTSSRPLYQHCTASLAGCDTIARAARIWFHIADHLRAATSEKQDESRPAAMRANPLPRIHHSATGSSLYPQSKLAFVSQSPTERVLINIRFHTLDVKGSALNVKRSLANVMR